MNILQSIDELITASGHISTDDIKYNEFPDGNNYCVMVRDTGELEPDMNDTSTKKIEHRTFQVMVRSRDYDQAVSACGYIRDALHQQIGVDSSQHHFLMIGTLSGLQPLSNDIGLYEFSGNFECMVRLRYDA